MALLRNLPGKRSQMLTVAGFCYHDEATLLIALSIKPSKHQIKTVDYLLKSLFIPLHPLGQKIGLPFKYGDPRHDEVPAFVVRAGFVQIQDIQPMLRGRLGLATQRTS